MLLGILAAAALLFVAWQFAGPRLHAWRRILRQRVPLAGRLPPDLQRQLKARMQVFLADKSFAGCGGLEITDEMRVTIAAQACLLRLNRTDEDYPHLRQVLVYPGPFIVERARTDGIGIVQDEQRVLSGESWARGQVILSWPDVLEGAANPDDGRSVVIHEFAHQLDQEKGFANGAPDLVDSQRYPRWSRVFGQEYGVLLDHVRSGLPTLLDPYGATDPAEFFAVCSEVFFERPGDLAAGHPALYGELSRFYRVDPLAW